MIPKMMKENGQLYPSSTLQMPPPGQVPTNVYPPILPQYHVNQFLPPNVIMQAPGPGDIESLMQTHRRKMLRRAANRRSAQQSRARKKALMGDLKAENERLQRLTDMLESQHELIFAIDKDGRITYISERCMNQMNSVEEEPSHVCHILTPESVNAVMESVAQVRTESAHCEDHANIVSSIREVCYHDGNGFQVTGYMRCSRLIRRTAMNHDENSSECDGKESDNGTEKEGPKPKKSRKNASAGAAAAASSTSMQYSHQVPMALTASNIAAVALADVSSSHHSSSSGTGRPSYISYGADVSNGSNTHRHHSDSSSKSSHQEDGHHHHHQSMSSGTSSNGATSHRGGLFHQDHHPMHNNHNHNDGQDDEYICVIRSADASFPHSHGGSQMFSSLLSTASMVAHDLELMNSGRERGEPGNMGDDTHHRRGGTSSVGSRGSHNSSGEEGSSASMKPRSDISKGLWIHLLLSRYEI